VVIRPVPRPNTPRFGGDDEFPVDLSPCGQRFDCSNNGAPLR